MKGAGAKSSSDGPPRPRDNPDLVGHAQAEHVLLGAVRSDRLPHAWMFTGPKGIGKATLAFRFARYLFAGGARHEEEGGLFGDPTSTSDREGLYVSPLEPVFRRVASAGHADLMTVTVGYDERKERWRTEIVVDDVRALASFLHLTPAEGGWRVAIIDSADEMNRSAANAALKLLEEPPPRVLILMVSHNWGLLPATIRSRCRRLKLEPLADDTVASLVARYRPELSGEGAAELARLGAGSVGRALSLAAAGGLDLHHRIHDLFARLPEIDMADLHRLGDRVGGRESDAAFRVAGDLVRWWLARVIALKAGGDTVIDGLASVTSAAGREDRAVLARLARAGDLDRWLEVWEKTSTLLRSADSLNLDRKQVTLSIFGALGGAARP